MSVKSTSRPWRAAAAVLEVDVLESFGDDPGICWSLAPASWASNRRAA